MAQQIISSVGNVFANCLNFTYQIFEATGMVPFYLAMVSILLIVSYLFASLLVPVKGSDSVSSRARNSKTGKTYDRNTSGSEGNG